MESLLHDVRAALRRLLATPAFTAVATLTIALATGATTSIYSVVDALLVRQLGYKDPHTLFQAINRLENGQRTGPLAYEKFLEWRQQRDIFAAVEPYNTRTVTLAGRGDPRTVFATEVGGGLMSMLGVTVILGRTIQPEDAQPGRDRVVVLGETLWRTVSGSDPAVVGRKVRLDDQVFEIVGVMPASFRFPRARFELWLPAPLVADRAGRPASYSALVRLAGGINQRQAQDRADAISQGLSTAKPLRGGWTIAVEPLQGMNPRERTALLVLFGAVGLVLLIACANVANLLLLQAAQREREIAVRIALGASRARLIRQLLSETLALAAAGGLLGVLLAWQAVELLAVYTPQSLTFLTANTIALDWRVLAFAVGLSLITALASGVLPALHASNTRPQGSLQGGVRAATGGPRQERLRRVFVVVQLALTLILLVGAGLLLRTFGTMLRVHPGFAAERLVTASMALPRWKYPSAEARLQYYDEVVARLKTLPGVEAATVAGGAPPFGGGISFGLKFEIEGRGVVKDDPRQIMPIASVPPEYFSVLGIPFRAGRTFTRADEGTPPASIVVNETMARELWKGDSPIGSRLRMGPDSPWYTVVGVAGDVYQFEHSKPQGQFATYYPIGSGRGGQLTIIVRTTAAPAGMVAAIQRQIWSVDPDQPILSIATVRERYGEFFDTPRFYALLMGSFAAIGLIVSAVGLYGVLAYAMTQRTRELGIRMALGADRADVLRMVLVSGGLLIGTGLALGGAGSLLMTRSLDSMLVNVPRTDPLTYAAVMAALAATGFAAIWIPARRATRVDPAVALRSD